MYKLPLVKDSNTILLIDNDRAFVRFFKKNLESNGYNVVAASNAKDGINLFYAIQPTFVTLAIKLADINGLEVLKTIVDVANKRFTPIVIVSKHDTAENRMLAYSIGATDFFAKPIQMEIFSAYLSNRLQTMKRIEQSTTVDELTHALNRRTMEKVLSSSIASYNRYNHVFSIVMLDVDHFKKVNDTYGHLEGDQVLKALAAIINNEKRESDYLFRFGGEEFLLILPQTIIKEAWILVNRIREDFENMLFVVGEERFHVTLSAGISVINDRNNDRDTLLEEADKALYLSKERGRNCITIA